MKATKKLLTVALFAILATGFVFAGGGKDKAKVDDEVIELRVLNYFEFTNPNVGEEVEFIWGAFAKAHPEIFVNREDLFNEPFHQKTEALAAAGRLSDVVYAWPSGRSTTLHRNKMLKDLTPFLKRDGLMDKFVDVAVDPKEQAGGYIAILPIGTTSTHVMYVNEKVLADAGLKPAKTYDELKAQVPVLKAKGYETILMANADDWVMQSCLFSAIAGRFGGAGWDQTFVKGNAKFTDKFFVDALKFVKTLYDDGVLSKNTLATDYGSVLGQFANDRGAYLIDGDWRFGAFVTDPSTGEALINKTDQENYISLMVFPDIEGVKLNKSTSGILGVGYGMSVDIPDGSAKEAAAWELIKWLNSKEVQEFRTALGGSIPTPSPSRKDLDLSKYPMDPLAIKISKFGTKYDATTVVIDGVFDADVHGVINAGLQEIGLGTKTPEQVANATQKAWEAWKAAH